LEPAFLTPLTEPGEERRLLYWHWRSAVVIVTPATLVGSCYLRSHRGLVVMTVGAEVIAGQTRAERALAASANCLRPLVAFGQHFSNKMVTCNFHACTFE